MSKIKEYTVVFRDSAEALSSEVSAKMQLDGWMPLGGVSVTAANFEQKDNVNARKIAGFYFAQAMVKGV